MKRIERYTTSRLAARRVCWADFEDAQQLHSDPLVARTLSADGQPLPEDTTRRMLRRAILHWRTHGFGLWMFRSRDNGEFIGRGGLIRYDALDMGGREEIGLAYAVLSPHWGQGYATEMGDASLRIGFRASRIRQHRRLDAAGQSRVPAGDGQAGLPVRMRHRLLRPAAPFLPPRPSGLPAAARLRRRRERSRPQVADPHSDKRIREPRGICFFLRSFLSHLLRSRFLFS